MDDKQIIALYYARSEDALKETARKYGAFCHSIAYHILASREDSEECVNDTYLKAWNAIPPRRPSKLSAFLGRITRNLALTRLEAYNAQKRGGGELPLALDELAECISSTNTTETLADERRLSTLLNRFLAQLPQQTRIIFLRRYWMLQSIKEIASGCGVSESKVKMTLLRTRAKLKHFLEQEEIAV